MTREIAVDVSSVPAIQDAVSNFHATLMERKITGYTGNAIENISYDLESEIVDEFERLVTIRGIRITREPGYNLAVYEQGTRITESSLGYIAMCAVMKAIGEKPTCNIY